MMAVDLAQDFLRRYHVVQPPAVGGADVHEFDEAQDHAGVTEVFGERNDLVFIDSALDHRIDLERGQPGRLCRSDAVKHGGDRGLRIAHALESFFAQPVEADGEARKPGILQRLRLLGQQDAIGGHGDFNRLAFVVEQFGQRFDQVLNAMPHQRLAAGQPDFLHAKLRENAGNALDFFKAEQLGARQENEVLAEDFARHAVGAAQIAAVGDRNAQIAQGPLPGIGDDGRWFFWIDHVGLPFSGWHCR